MSKRTLNMSLLLSCFHTENVTLQFDFMPILIKRKVKTCNENNTNDSTYHSCKFLHWTRRTSPAPR